MKWVSRFFIAVNILLSLITSTGYLASYIEPRVNTLPQVIGLFMPWLLLMHLFFILLWGSLRKKWVFLSFFTLLVGLGQITRFIGFHFTKKSDANQLVICSFNCQNYNETSHLTEFLEEIKGETTLDLICLQEITEKQLGPLKKTSDLDYHYFHKGKAILSRLPLEKRGHIQFDQSVNGCIWADLKWKDRELRIYNLHLRSNQVTKEAESVLQDFNSDNTSQAISKIRRAVTNYRRNCQIRQDQVIAVMKDVDQCTIPVMIAGDFNDTPFSYTYQQAKRRLDDHFKKKGLGVGSTYAGSIPGLKIDYIFTDQNFEVLDHRIIKTAVSDHFPILSVLKFKD